MNRHLLTILGIGASLVMTQSAFAADKNAQPQNANAAASSLIKTENDKVSYTIGVDIGENLKSQSMKVNADIMARGIKDALTGGQYLMSKDEMQTTIMNLQKNMMAEQQSKMKEMAEQNSKAGKTFLDNNKKQQGVTTLASGLQYKVVEAGKGNVPNANDYVTVDYEGKLLSGDVFDSSYKRGKPVQFKVSQVIPGWQEALQKMQTGATWELFVPPQLAYGDKGLGGPIGPEETLLFKVHLISIDKEPAPAATN